MKTNIGGAGLKLSVGFELGDREEYWFSFEQLHMSGKIAAWKVGIYKRVWDDVYYYDNDKSYLEYDRISMVPLSALVRNLETSPNITGTCCLTGIILKTTMLGKGTVSVKISLMMLSVLKN